MTRRRLDFVIAECEASVPDALHAQDNRNQRDQQTDTGKQCD